MWFGTDRGASQYDGQRFQNFTVQDGLAHDQVLSLFQDPEGALWLGTPRAEDQRGHLWFSTGAGATQYDGVAFQSLRQRDGLAHDQIRYVLSTRNGDTWISTQEGFTRYRPGRVAPAVQLMDIVADQRLGPVEELSLPSSQDYLSFEFQGRSFSTRPEGMAYAYRLEGYDADWRPAYEGRAEYAGLPRGEYLFQVKAVDRDLNYSERPATVRVRVHLPYERLAWTLALGVAVLLVAWQTGRVVRRDRRLQESNSALSAANKELFQLNQELRQANQQIQQASRFKSDFLARMSHDLRTPMNAIIGYTRILLRKLQDQIDPRQYHNLENIQLSASRLLSLINDILDLSRIEAGRIDLKPESVDLGEVVAQCAAAVESLLKPGVELKQELADLAPLHTDADRLHRVLMNLLSNAVKFTEAGRITVSAKPVEEWIELSVADTGIGIPAEDLPHIFEEFRQSGRRGEGEKQGSGLGLAIARKSVELLGGSIAVASQVGEGTRFTLRIRDYQG